MQVSEYLHGGSVSGSENHEPTPVNLSPEGTELARRIDAVLDALTDFRVSQMQVNQQVMERLDRADQRFEQIDQRFEQIDQRFEQIDQRFEQVDQRFEQIEQRAERTDRRLERTDRRLERTDRRLERIDQDIGYLHGAHAINAAERNASLIADDMGYQLISLVPRDVLIGFANMARDAGKAEDDVRSFREADLVILARDRDGYPAYIVVEASFTVASNDINRVKRNAAYLHEFTGLPAWGAVAGVNIASGREQNANNLGVYCYRIPARHLESD